MDDRRARRELAKVNQHVALVGPDAEVQVNGVMFTEGKQHLSYHTHQHHMAPYCRSDLLYKAALQDRSRTVWRGMIKVDKVAQRTDAYQRNDNLMLSRDARADSIPGLEIEADDVRCTHGSTTGRVDESQIFYAMARGLHAARSDADDRHRLLPAGLRPDHDRERPRSAGRSDRPPRERHPGLGRSMTAWEVVAVLMRLVGLVCVVPGLFLAASGVRTVVSGRIDERQRSAKCIAVGTAAVGGGRVVVVRWFMAGKLGGAIMADFVPVAKVTDVPDPGKELVEVGERLVVLIHAAGHWYALDDVCTHDGGPLSDGPLDPAAGTIACPRHGAKFDVKTGAALTMPATKPTKVHEVKIEGDRVLVRLVGRLAASGAPRVKWPPEVNIMPIAEDKVREALKQVIDPELFVNVVDLGLIYEVKIDEQPDGKSNVGINMTMTSPACPAGPQLLGQSKDFVGRLEGVGEVDVRLVMDPPWTPDRMTEDARDQLGIF